MTLPGGSLGDDDATSAWLRAWVRVPERWTRSGTGDLWAESVTVTLQGVPTAYEVLVNGKSIGRGGSPSPQEEPDAGRQHRHKVPPGTLARGAWNVLAIRLHAPHGGLLAPETAPSIQGYFLECVLEGEWELRFEAFGAEGLEPRSERPARAAYADFREASRVLAEPVEAMPGRRVPPEESAGLLRTSGDLEADLVLSEPVVTQPTHLSFDARGRLWVAQYRQYPYPAGVEMVSRDKYYRAKYDRVPPPPPEHDRGRDRITVHEDTDGDGEIDTHRVFVEGLNLANAALRGHGGVWVMQPPYLLFYPDRDGDDVPDGDPEVRLAGFGIEDTHAVANGLVWGPDGWLYGAQGSTVACRVVRPDVDPPDAPGVYHEGCMVWRYHPERKTFEIFARGGGNVFSLEFDDDGRLFSGHNGGDTRGWHYVQSGYHLKQARRPGKYGPPSHPYAFGELPKMRGGRIARFTHTLVVADGAALPGRLHGRLVCADPLHRRLVLSERIRRGATWRTEDLGFPLESDDPTFRPVFLARGADGALWIADFAEEFIAHGQHYQGQIDRSSGRIWRLRSKDAEPVPPGDLTSKSTRELIALFEHADRWRRHTAVRLIAQRGDTEVVPRLVRWIRAHDGRPALEALWTVAQLGALDTGLAIDCLDHEYAPVRAWTVRLLGDAGELPSPFFRALLERLPGEPDVEVAAQVASTAQRVPFDQALPLIRILGMRDADADDPYLPLLVWWALERACAEHREEVVALFEDEAFRKARLVRQTLLERVMRRFAATGRHAGLTACARLLELATEDGAREALLEGFEKAYSGRSIDALPAELADRLAGDRGLSLVLLLRRGDSAAFPEARATVLDREAAPERRAALARVLGEVAPPGELAPLLELLRDGDDPVVLRATLASLQRLERPRVAERVLDAYDELPEAVRPAALSLLASRPAWALRLVAAVEDGTIPRASIPADAVMALRLHPGGELRRRVERVFDASSPLTDDEAAREIARVRDVLRDGSGRPYRGERIFTERCASCHRLFHKGQDVGPDLTSYQRDDVSALLLAIVDPGAEVREGFEGFLAWTRDGRQLVGRIADRTETAVALRGTDGTRHLLRRDELRSLEPLGRSLMPDGLLEGLGDQELRDLFAYLRIAQPIRD